MHNKEFEGISGTLLKVLGVAAVGGGVTTLAVGGVSAVSASTGVVGAGVAAYAAAEAIREEGVETIIAHTSPANSTSEAFFWNNSVTESGNTAFSEANSTLDVHASLTDRMMVHTPVDPEIAKALSHYHEMKDVMRGLGFITLEAEEEFSSAHLYGCPTQQMSRSSATFSR